MIYVFFAEGFEEIEAIGTVDILRRAELEVKTVGVGGKHVTGAHGITVTTDLSESEAATDGLEMVVLPGGMPGTLNLEQSKTVQRFIDHAMASDLWLAAICAAPSILGHKGLLKGKKATCYPGFEVAPADTEYQADRVVRDGKLVTGKGPGAAIPFAVKLVECLKGSECAASVEAALQ